MAENKWIPEFELETIEPKATVLLPAQKVRYLAEIAEGGRRIASTLEDKCAYAAKAQHYYESLSALADKALPEKLEKYPQDLLEETNSDESLLFLRRQYNYALRSIGEQRKLLLEWPKRLKSIRDDQYSYEVRGKNVTGENYVAVLGTSGRYNDSGAMYSDLNFHIYSGKITTFNITGIR